MKRKRIFILLSPVFIVAFWFLAVDGSWFVEFCPDCFYGRDVYQIRILSIPVWQDTKESQTLLEKVARDVGAECHHPRLERWHKHRWWGLLYCACPCINGTIRLSGEDEWYDAKASQIVQEMARTDPSLPAEFARRIYQEHDWEYLKAFYKKIEDLRAAQTPAKAQVIVK